MRSYTNAGWAPAAVPAAPRDRDQALRLERLDETAEIARIEPEPHAEGAEIDAVGADFENEPRLRQRPASAQVVGLERADAPGDQTVEAPNLPELALHSLTLVRHRPISSLARTAACFSASLH